MHETPSPTTPQRTTSPMPAQALDLSPTSPPGAETASGSRSRATVSGWRVVVVALVASLVPGMSRVPVGAQDRAEVTLRIACVAPRGSVWHRVLTAWGNTLRQSSGGRLGLAVVAGGAGVSEDDFVRRMGRDELDGAVLSALGLAALGRERPAARSALVLQAPGLFTEYAPFDRARAALDTELRAALRESGVELVGWSDLGRGRIFSTRPITTPAELRAARIWQPPDEPMSSALLAQLGVSSPVRVPFAEVGNAIAAGRVDVVVASSMAVSALGWAGPGRLTHVSSQPTNVLVGATVIAGSDVAALPADLQEQLRSTAVRAHEMLQRSVRSDDERAYQTLTMRQGLTSFALAADADWRALADATRARLIGEGILPRALVERAATFR